MLALWRAVRGCPRVGRFLDAVVSTLYSLPPLPTSSGIGGLLNNVEETIMENKSERDYLQLETEFNQAQATVSCISDLLMIAHNNSNMPLANNTLGDSGYVCFEATEKMKSLFSEMLALYLKK